MFYNYIGISMALSTNVYSIFLWKMKFYKKIKNTNIVYIKLLVKL